MHLKTLGDLLKSAGYTPKDGVAAGQIEKIEIHRENRLVRLKTKFEAFVPYSDLREVNGMLHERILPDMRVELAPAFPAQAWQESCVTSVLERVRELDASLNGTFKDADCTINENTLTIELLHGATQSARKAPYRPRHQRNGAGVVPCTCYGDVHGQNRTAKRRRIRH